MVRIPAEETIKVKWIVGVYYAAFVGVVIYVLYDIITSHRWADFTPPSTYLSAWVVGDRSWHGPHSNYWCLNSTFDWPLTTSQYQYEGPHNLTNVSCAWLDNTDIASFIHDGSIGLPTFYEVAAAGQSVPTPYFVTDVAALTLNFNHGFQHDATGSTPLPETIVYDISGKEYTRFASTSLMALSFTDFEKILNVNLDAKTPTLPQLGVADSTFRHTGVYVLMSFTYSNYDSGTAAERVVCRVTFNVVADVWGVLETKDRTEYHGIKLTITQGGSIGFFSTFVFGVYILNTIVFLGVAEFLARSAFMLQKRLRQQCPCMQTIVEDSSDEDNDGVAMKSTVVNMVDDGNSAPHSLNGSQQVTSARHHHHHHGADTPVKYLTPEIDDVDNGSGFPVRQ